jgi:hypothetical protein
MERIIDPHLVFLARRRVYANGTNLRVKSLFLRLSSTNLGGAFSPTSVRPERGCSS